MITKVERTWSKYQEAIFNAVTKSEDSLLIEAVAGSGKTTTIVEAVSRVPQGKSVCFLAFNKSIADSLKSKLPRTVKCQTLHAAGFAAWRQHLAWDAQELRVESGKTRMIIEGESGPFTEQEREDWNGTLTRLVSIAKNAGIGSGGCPGLLANTDENWLELAEFYNLEMEDIEGRLEIVRKVMTESVARAREIIDYDDMLYVPVLLGVPFGKFDVVFLDEAQDVSGIQVEMVSRMVHPTSDPQWDNYQENHVAVPYDRSRVIAVGDRFQSIYGFRGALSDSMDQIKRRFGCKELPLSVTYRCGRKIVEHVQRLVPHIEWWEGSGEGTITYLGEQWNSQTFVPGDAILCRVNRPLASLAFHLIRSKVPAKVLGRDIGTGLVKLVESQKARTVGELEEKLGWYCRRHTDKLVKKGQKEKLAQLSDRMDTIQVFIDEFKPGDPVAKLTASINMLFTDDGNSVVMLSTVHKAKGLQWDRVFILDAEEYMPSPWASQPWELAQEKNIQYVAETRAAAELIYIQSSTLLLEKSGNEHAY